jgi:purine-cytosine permease-like protein
MYGAAFLVITSIFIIRNKMYIWFITFIPGLCLIIFSLTDILDFIPNLAVSISFYIISILTIFFCGFYSAKKDIEENLDDSSD